MKTFSQQRTEVGAAMCCDISYGDNLLADFLASKSNSTDQTLYHELRYTTRPRRMSCLGCDAVWLFKEWCVGGHYHLVTRVKRLRYWYLCSKLIDSFHPVHGEISSSETSVLTRATQRHNPRDGILHSTFTIISNLINNRLGSVAET
jgi:hypothetical protein